MENDPRVRRALDRLAALGVEPRAIRHPESGRSSEDAARALGLPPEAVVKCLLLEEKDHARSVAAILLGPDRLDVKALQRVADARDLRMASPERIESITGFRPGGIPAFCLPPGQTVVVDEPVLARAEVACSAGSEFVGCVVPTGLFARLGYARGSISKKQAG